MATFTEHYDLIKPGTDDYYDVADFNENMDAIDTQLYQTEQDMAGVSEKIGNPGDEGEDTLFGLLHPNNQPEEKADFYRYSTTEIKKRITNWSPGLAASARIYAKLTTLHAEKNGTVYVKIVTTDKAATGLGVYTKVPYQIVNAPDQSTFSNDIPGFSHEEKYEYFYDQFGTTTAQRQNSREFVFHVIAGVDYTFMYTGYSVSNAKVDEFLLGYTDTVEA